MTNKESPDLKNHQVVSHEQWLAARIALLANPGEQGNTEEARRRFRGD